VRDESSLIRSGSLRSLGCDRGRLIYCTEVGVPMLAASRQAIHVRHPRALRTVAAVVVFGLCLLGPGVPVLVVAGTSISAAVIDHRTLRIPNRLVLVCWVVVVGAHRKSRFLL
jgi:hypothetical protein